MEATGLTAQCGLTDNPCQARPILISLTTILFSNRTIFAEL